MSKIKVLFCIGNLNIGGAEKLILNQIKNIDHNNFDPVLLTLFPEKKDSYTNLNNLPIPIYQSVGFKGPLDIVSWFKTYQLLKREKFDIICTHLFEANFIIRFVNLFVRCPRVFVFEHNIYWKKAKWKILADRFFSYQTTKIFVDSQAVLDFTSKQEKIAKDKFAVLPYPIELAPLPDSTHLDNLKRELNLPADYVIVGSVARFVEQKGLKYFLQAIRFILDHQTLVKAHFLLVGYGNLEEALKDEAKKLKLDSVLTFSPPRDIKTILPIIDIFVLSSLWEGQPIAMLEAMAAKRAVVATNVGGVSEILLNRENGLIVEKEDSKALGKAILELINNKDLRLKLGQNGFDAAVSFGLPTYIKKLERFFLDAYGK